MKGRTITVRCHAMTRREWKALPEEVRAFVPWSEASRAKTVTIPAPAVLSVRREPGGRRTKTRKRER